MLGQIFANLYARAEDLSPETAVEATDTPVQAADLSPVVEASAPTMAATDLSQVVEASAPTMAAAADLTSAVDAGAVPDSALSVALTYGGLFGFYFLVLPPLILQYCRSRWYTRSSIETVLMFMLVFLDFPGLLIWAPFVNFRPDGRDNRVL